MTVALALFGGDPRLISDTSMAHIAAALKAFRGADGAAEAAAPRYAEGKGR
jgi:hypothetical protein